MANATFQISQVMIDGSILDISKCCGELPMVVTSEMTGDWEGFKCVVCERTVYGLDDEGVKDWNEGTDKDA